MGRAPRARPGRAAEQHDEARLCALLPQGAAVDPAGPGPGRAVDVADQPVPVALRYPSPVAGLGIPYSLGPVGGAYRRSPRSTAVRTPPPGTWDCAASTVSASSTIGCCARPISGQAACRDRAVRRRSAGSVPLQRFEVMSDVGIEELPAPVDRTARPDGAVRLLFVGLLIRTKGARDAISALGLARDLPVTLDIVGDGFDRTACEKLAADLGLTDRVRFHGRVPRDQVDSFDQTADIFVFPSYREPGGSVVFEAMGQGLPLVVSDRGGPGHMVEESCGIRLHPVEPGQYAADLAAASPAGPGPVAAARTRRRSPPPGRADRAVGQQGKRVEEIHSEMLAACGGSKAGAMRQAAACYRCPELERTANLTWHTALHGRSRVMVVLNADDRFSRPLAVTIRSIVSQLSPGRTLDLYVCDMGITPANRIKIESVPHHDQVNFSWISSLAEETQLPADIKHISRAAYGRLIIRECCRRTRRRSFISTVTLSSGGALAISSIRPSATSPPWGWPTRLAVRFVCLRGPLPGALRACGR